MSALPLSLITLVIYFSCQRNVSLIAATKVSLNDQEGRVIVHRYTFTIQENACKIRQMLFFCYKIVFYVCGKTRGRSIVDAVLMIA